MRIRTLLPLAATFSLLALSALAQSTSNEFGRVDAGPIVMTTKSSQNQLSGTFSLSRSDARGGTGYDGSLGGTIVPDRVWFFASAAVLPPLRLSTTFAPAGISGTRAMDAKVDAQPVDWSNVSASFRNSQTATTMFGAPFGTVPSSWLSLHSTSMLNDHSMLELSFSQRNAK